MLVRGDAVHEISGSGPRRDLSQPCPDNWLPLRPAESRWFSEHALADRLTRTEWDGSTPIGMRRDPSDLPDNAEVAGFDSS